MHESQLYFNTSLYSRLSLTGLTQTSLTSSEASSLNSALRSDAYSYFHSSCISLADAIRGLEKDFFSWTTVKSYYSCFYSIRAILAINGIGIIYDTKTNQNKNTPYVISATAGSCLIKGKGTTHKFTIDLFSRHFSNDPIVNHQIDTKPPLLWLMEQREIANYRNAKFVEPTVPQHFSGIKSIKNVQQAFSSYVNDTADVYTFDKDHAIMALPIKLINKIKSHINLSQTDKEIISAYFQSEQGMLTFL